MAYPSNQKFFFFSLFFSSSTEDDILAGGGMRERKIENDRLRHLVFSDRDC